jgi:glucokinase
MWREEVMAVEEDAYYIGVDLGGTRLRVALADCTGRILRRRVVPTGGGEGRDAVLGRIIVACRMILEPEPLPRLCRVGVAIAGPVDPRQGVVYHPPNLPGWGEVPLSMVLERELTVPVLLGNDAHLAAVAEHCWGAGRNLDHLVYLTVSTGIGAGVIINRRLLLGAHGGASEIGHVTIDLNGPRCGCGNHGCLEAMASGTALAEEAMRRLGQGECSVLLEHLRRNPGRLDAETVVGAALQGDALARAVIQWAGYNLGVGLAAVMHLYDPQAIIIGGGVANAWDHLMPSAWQALRERAMDFYLTRVRITRSELGDEAGIRGAVALAIRGPNGLWPNGL